MSDPTRALLQEQAIALLLQRSPARDHESVSKSLRALFADADGGAPTVPLLRELVSCGQGVLVDALLRLLPDAVRARPDLGYVEALNLARMGSAARALEALERISGQLAPGSAENTEAMALRGRIAKDQAMRCRDPLHRHAFVAAAIRGYAAAARASADRDPFPLINLASLHALQGTTALARAYAGQARDAALAALERGDDPLWQTATLGEAALVLGDADAAAEWYGRARRVAGRRLGDLASVHRQIRGLLARLPFAAEMMRIVAPGPVLTYTGHRALSASASEQVFWEELRGEVAAALEAIAPSLVIGSAASGVDLIVLEEAQARGIDCHVWLPFERESFVQRSVAAGGADWVRRFEATLARATRNALPVDEVVESDATPFLYLADLLVGSALLNARRLETHAAGLVVRDPRVAPAPGGTADTLARWRHAGLAVRELAMARPPAASEHGPDPQIRVIRTVLFADLKGSSGIRDERMPAFLDRYLDTLHDVLATVVGVEAVNTWGDGLFVVFHSASEAARFALRLRDALAAIDASAFGLDAPISIRCALHTGPVFWHADPLLGRGNAFGKHVVKPARIEPVARPGAVWLSEECACHLALARADDLAFEYLGRQPLAKAYDANDLYELDWSASLAPAGRPG